MTTATINRHYNYASVPTLRRFSFSKKFIRGIVGPFGSGKSSACVVEIGRLAAVQTPGPDGIRRSRWAIVRNTYPQLRDTSLKTWLEWFPDSYAGRWHESSHTFTMKFGDVEAEILFRALDRPDHVKNLLSLELTGAWINEAREIPKSIFEALQGRVGRYPSIAMGGPTWYGVMLDTNPPDQDSWWYRFFEEIKPSNAELFKQPSGLSEAAENLVNLIGGRRYYENLCVGKESEYVKVYVHGNYGFVIDGKPVYPEYSDQIHCGEFEPIKSVVVLRGWDFGLTPACVLTQLVPSGRWQVFDELLGEEIGIKRFRDYVLTELSVRYPWANYQDYGDPSGNDRSETDEKTCFQILQAGGVKIEAGEQSLMKRIESVREPLSRIGGFMIHPRCKMLRKGFMGGYQYRRIRVSDEKYTSEPDKNMYSHPHDALQYVATQLFAKGLVTRKRDIADERPQRLAMSEHAWMG